MLRPYLIATSVITGAATLAACATTMEPRQRSPQAAAELARYLDGKTPGKAETCLPSYRSQDMIVVDENTILYRDGSNRYWRNDLQGNCNGLGRPGTFLLTKQFGNTGTCRGEIARIVDSGSGATVGLCSFGDFVPYTGPRRP